MNKTTLSPIDYAQKAAHQMMKNFSAADLPPKGRFHYHQGVFLSGIERTYLTTGDEEYYNYIKNWADSVIDADGNINNRHNDQLDDMQPANLLFNIYKKTENEKYRKVIESSVENLRHWPKNEQGGFWHMKNLSNQMWLDGIYMAGPLLVRYALEFGESELLEIVYTQLRLMRENMTDEKTGLMYHAWNSSGECMWADSRTHCSPEFWGRAIGWYAVTAVDIADMLPSDSKYKTYFAESAAEILKALAKYQDEELGVWFQVVDKAHKKDNWPETSCSALFTYAFSKAVRLGYLPQEYACVAHKGYMGVINSTEITFRGEFTVPRVCIGTGVGDYGFYVKRSAITNDLHGMGAFLLMCNEYNML